MGPVLPPGAYASTPPDLGLGQPGFDGLEGEDSIQTASLPNDEYLVTFFFINLNFFSFIIQETITEGQDSVQLTSSLRWVILYLNKNMVSVRKVAELNY